MNRVCRRSSGGAAFAYFVNFDNCCHTCQCPLAAERNTTDSSQIRKFFFAHQLKVYA